MHRVRVARLWLFALLGLAAFVVGSGISSAETTYSRLYTFTGSNGDGAQPYAGLIFDASGALYGTTFYGGGTNSVGSVFKLTPPTIPGGAWAETVLYAFAGGSD